LQAHLARAATVGLAEANPLDSLVLVQPAALGQRAYDEVAQTLHWPLRDQAGNELLLAVKFDESTAPAIEAVESLPAANLPGCRWLGRARLAADRLQLYPYALLRPTGEIVNLGFAPKQPAPGKRRPPAAEPEREAALDEEEAPELVPAGSALGRLLAECEEALLALAESGAGSLFPSRLEQLSALAARADTLGLQVLAGSLRFAAAPAAAPLSLRINHSREGSCSCNASTLQRFNASTLSLRPCRAAFPAALLRSRYHCWLHRQAASSVP
jgi:hypothetical protein